MSTEKICLKQQRKQHRAIIALLVHILEERNISILEIGNVLAIQTYTCDDLNMFLPFLHVMRVEYMENERNESYENLYTYNTCSRQKKYILIYIYENEDIKSLTQAEQVYLLLIFFFIFFLFLYVIVVGGFSPLRYEHSSSLRQFASELVRQFILRFEDWRPGAVVVWQELCRICNRHHSWEICYVICGERENECFREIEEERKSSKFSIWISIFRHKSHKSGFPMSHQHTNRHRALKSLLK